jgi:hypothetical protein
VASFFQHDSRDHDPQLHIHNAILNRVQGTDGQWRTLDSRAVHKFRGAAGAVGERTMEAHLTHALGVRVATRPDGKAREIVGIAVRAMELFSSRRRKITPAAAKLVSAFEAKFGREPNALERDRLQRQATFATRQAKSHDSETVEERLDRWAAQLRGEVAGGLAGVADAALAAGGHGPAAQSWSPRAVMETALAAVQAKKSGWTEADLTREIGYALPDTLGNLTGAQITTLMDSLTATAVQAAVRLDAAGPAEDVTSPTFRLANGRSAFEEPGGRLFATPEQVHSERLLLAGTTRRDAPALGGPAVDGFVTTLAGAGVVLGADQAAAVRGVLTSGASVESLVGPAGTGKSFVVGALAKAWQDPALWGGNQRRVVGLAASQAATEILAGEGVAARNIARWLATQQRLGEGNTGGDDEQWRLRPGDMIVVDESAMASTADLAAIHDRARAAGAKVLLTGDHRQLAAVGAGGGMEMLAEAGAAYELSDVRRFTAEWERAASLRLRAGEVAALDEYHKNGRLLDAGTAEDAAASAARAWLADTLEGRHSVLVVDSNDEAARLSAEIRSELVRLGRVDEAGVRLGLQGTYAGRGDLVQARLNGWHLAGFEGNRRGPINREQYRVLGTRADGGLVVAPVVGHDAAGERLGEQMALPGDYVAEHVALGYASTAHAAQGLTVDTAHLVATPATGAGALYVGLSRGRENNTAHVATVSTPEMVQVDRAGQVDVVDDQHAQDVHRAPRAVLATTLDTAQPEHSALATRTDSAEAAESVATAGERLAEVARVATAGRTARWLDELTAAGELTGQDRARLAAEDADPALSRLLRRAEIAGHDPRHVLADAVAGRPLTGARDLTNVLHHRITAAADLTPRGTRYADWTPRVDDPADQQFLAALADAADARRAELGRQVAADAPAWAVEAFGPPPPAGDPARAAWLDKAGLVAAHRELTGHTDPDQAIGPTPPAGLVENYASWHATWDALGRPVEVRDEWALTDGQLRLRVRAGEREEAWSPRYVANELAGTRQAAAAQRQTATMRTAEAQAATDILEHDRLLLAARDAAALADALDAQIIELEHADRARAEHRAHTAGTRAVAERAKAVLAERHADDPHPEPVVTAEQWLAEQEAAQRAEDSYRPITDADVTAGVDVDGTAADSTTGGVAVETGVPDVREVAAAEPPQAGEDAVRVPAAEETAVTLAHARRALAEVRERTAWEQEREAENEHAAQLIRWQVDDLAAESTVEDASEWDPELVIDDA